MTRVLLNICRSSEVRYVFRFVQAKTHEKVDSLGENRSIAVHAVCMLIREDMVQ